jgi:hypothetical protein
MSTAICNATNSEPNLEDSNVFCALEYHMTRALQIDQDACLGLTCDSTTSMVSVYKNVDLYWISFWLWCFGMYRFHSTFVKALPIML